MRASHLNLLIAGLILVSLGPGCQVDRKILTVPDPPAPIDPATEPDELSRRFLIAGLNLFGTLPGASANGPEILAVQPTASVTAASTLFLPFSYRSGSAIRGLYLTVAGATNYWRVDLEGGTTEGTAVLPIGIPAEVIPGGFSIEYSLYDASGNIGESSTLTARIVAPTEGAGGSIEFPVVEGNDGLTVRTYDVGAGPGTVTIEWQTYSVPDRIDIRYAGDWVSSTGTILGPSDVPPIADCSEVGPDDGFIGSSGTFAVRVDPGKGGRIDVYVSGCLDGGTQWRFQVKFKSEKDFASMPDCPCRFSEVPFGNTTDGSGNVTGTWSDATAATTWIYHPGAAHEVRWSPKDQARPAGQQCTYDTGGSLITSGIGAGTRDIVSPGISLTGHYTADVAPWSTVSCVEYYANWPTNRGGGCADNPQTPFRHMLAMTRGMPCPEIRDFIGVVKASTFSPPILRSYVLGELDYIPDDQQLRDDLKAILDHETGAYGYLRPVAHAYRNLGGEALASD